MIPIVEGWERCVLCQISFASERAAKHREKSRRHLQAIGQNVLWTAACRRCGKCFTREPDRDRHERKQQCRGQRRNEASINLPIEPRTAIVQTDAIVELRQITLPLEPRPATVQTDAMIELRQVEPTPVIADTISGAQTALQLKSIDNNERLQQTELKRALWMTLKTRDHALVEQILKLGAQPNFTEADCEFLNQQVPGEKVLMPLIWAIMQRDAIMIGLLCQYGATLDLEEPFLVALASNIGSKPEICDVFRVLLRYGSFQKHRLWASTLVALLEYGHPDQREGHWDGELMSLVQLLIENRPSDDLSAYGEAFLSGIERAMLHFAYHDGNAPVVDALLMLPLDTLSVEDPSISGNLKKTYRRSLLELVALKVLRNFEFMSEDPLRRLRLVELLLEAAKQRWTTKALHVTKALLTHPLWALEECELVCDDDLHDFDCRVPRNLERGEVNKSLERLENIFVLIDGRLEALGE